MAVVSGQYPCLPSKTPPKPRDYAECATGLVVRAFREVKQQSNSRLVTQHHHEPCDEPDDEFRRSIKSLEEIVYDHLLHCVTYSNDVVLGHVLGKFSGEMMAILEKSQYPSRYAVPHFYLRVITEPNQTKLILWSVNGKDPVRVKPATKGR